MNSSRVLIYITEQGKKIKGLIPTINIRVSTEFLFSNVGRLLSANLVLYVDKSLCIWNIHFVILVLLRRQRECTTQLSKSLSFLNINIKLHGNVFNFWLILNALFVRFVWTFLDIVLMCFLVFSEVVASHEALATLGALEALLACVRSQMSLKLVWPSEALSAEQPVTHKRSLASVPAKMGFEVRCLSINFTTTRDMTNVLLSLCSVPCSRCELAVWASAPSAASCSRYLARQRRSTVRAGQVISGCSTAGIRVIAHRGDVACRCYRTQRQTLRNSAGDRATYNGFIRLYTPPVKSTNLVTLWFERCRAAQR